MENRPEYLNSQSVNISYDTDMTIPTYYQVSAELENQAVPVTLHLTDGSIPSVNGLHAERPDVLALATATLLQGSYSDTSGYIPVQNLVLSQQQCAQFTQLGAVMESSLVQGSSSQEDVPDNESNVHNLSSHEVQTTHASELQGQATHTSVIQGQTTHADDLQGQTTHSIIQGQATHANVLQRQADNEDQLVTQCHILENSGLQGASSEMQNQTGVHSSLIQLSSLQQVEAGMVFGGQHGSVGSSPLMLVKPGYTPDSMVLFLNSSSATSDVVQYSETPATETFIEKKKRATRSKPAARKKDNQVVNSGSSKTKPVQTLPPDGIISSEDLGGQEMTSNTIIALMKKKFNKKGLKINECPYCKKGLSSREALRTHLRTHTGERPYQCEDCGKSFSDCSVFRRHQRIHTGEKPYVCDVCGKAFNQSTSLESHKRTHTGTKKYTCEVCGLGFDKLQQLVDHCRTENHGNIKTYKCPKCSVEVQDEVTLKRHMCSHTGERAYSCHICGAKWEKQYALMEHLRMHAGIKPYDCPECDEKFVRKGDLRVHMNRHTVNKFMPHKCQTCGEGFKQKAQLMVHERIHTGIKPYGCKACGKSFYSWKDLREHRRKHSGKRIYKCDHCGKMLTTMNTLKIHVKMHMKGGAISCSICSKMFHDTNDFVHHTRFDHKVSGANSESDSEDAESVPVTTKRKRSVKSGKKNEAKHMKSSESKNSSNSSEETSSDVESVHDDDDDEDVISPSDSFNSDDDDAEKSSLQDSGKAADSQKAAGDVDSSTQSVLRNSNMNSDVPGASQMYYTERVSGIENLVRASVLSDAVSMEIQASEHLLTAANSTKLDPLHTDSSHSEGPVIIGQEDPGKVSSGQFTLLTAAHMIPTVSMMSSLQDLTPVAPSSLQLICSSSQSNVNRADISSSHECPPVMNPHIAEYVQGFVSSIGPPGCERGTHNLEERASQVVQEPDYEKKIQQEKEGEEINIEQRALTSEQQSASEVHDQNNYEISDSSVNKSQSAVSQELHYQQLHMNQDQLPAERIENVPESQQLASHSSPLVVQTHASEQDASDDVPSQMTAGGEVVQLDASNEGKGEAKSEMSDKEGITTAQLDTVESSSLELASQDQFIRCSQQMSSNSCQDNGYLSYTKYLTLPTSLDDNAYTAAIKDYTNSFSYSLQFPQAFHPQTVAAFTTEGSSQEAKLYVERGFDSIIYSLPHVSSVFPGQSAVNTVDSQAVSRSVDYSINLQTLINTSLAQEAAKVTKDQHKKQDKGYSRKFYKSLECQYCGKGLSSVPALKNHEMIHTGERPYKCECGKSFIDSSTFKRHQRIHTGIKPYMCDVCGKQFNQSNSYRTHMTCHTGEKHYKCNVCGQSFDKLKKLMDHNQRENHGSVKKHTCSVCSAVFRDLAALERHMCSHTGEKAFKCKYCDKSYEKQYQFNEHMHSHSGFKPFKCEICGDSFLRKGQLKFHVYKHQYGRQFECEFCHQAFYRSTDLTVHRRIHTGEKPFKCDQCERSFRQKWECKNHQLWDHSTEKPFTCDKCSKTFKKSYSLKLHMQNKHENEKRHKCIVCKKRFRKLENLKKHARKHRSLNCRLCNKHFLTERKTQQHMEKFHKDDRRVIRITKRKEKQKLECSECGKKFCFRYDLEEHKRLHTGDSIYKCTICNKIFSREYHLNIHTMKHTGEKRFKCDECGEPFTSGRKLKNHRVEKHGASETDIFKCEICQREFSDRNTMKKHVKSHSTEKPYQCQTCGKRYQYSWNLKIHEKSSHTGDMPFKCRFCQKMFTHRRDYRDHVRSHTDNLPFRCPEAGCGRSFASLRALRMHQPIHFVSRYSAPDVVTTTSVTSAPTVEQYSSTECGSSKRENVIRNDSDGQRYLQNDGRQNSDSILYKSLECNTNDKGHIANNDIDGQRYSQNGSTCYESFESNTSGTGQGANSDIDGQSNSQNASSLLHKSSDSYKNEQFANSNSDGQIDGGLLHRPVVEWHTNEREHITSGRSDVKIGQNYSQHEGNIDAFQGNGKECAQSTSGNAVVVTFGQGYSQNSSSIHDESSEDHRNGSEQITGDAADSVISYPQSNDSERVKHVYTSLQSNASRQRDSIINQKEEKGIEFKNDVQMHTDSQETHQLEKYRHLDADSHHLSITESVGNTHQSFVQKDTSSMNNDIDNNTEHQNHLTLVNTEIHRAVSNIQEQSQIPAMNMNATSYFHQPDSSTINIQPQSTTSYIHHHRNPPITNTEPHMTTVNDQHLKGFPIMSSRIIIRGSSVVEQVDYMSSDYKPSNQIDQPVDRPESVPCQSEDIPSESFRQQSQTTSDEHVQLQSNGQSQSGLIHLMPSNQQIDKHNEQNASAEVKNAVYHTVDEVIRSTLDTSSPHSNASMSSTAENILHRNKHPQGSYTSEHTDTALANYQGQLLESVSHNVVFINGNPINYSLPFYKNTNTSSQQAVQTQFGENVHLLQSYDKVYELPRPQVDDSNHGKAASVQPHNDATEFTAVTSTMHEPQLFHLQRSNSPWNRAATSVGSPLNLHEGTWSGHMQSSDAWNRTTEPTPTTSSTSHENQEYVYIQRNENSWNRGADEASKTSINEPEKASYLQWSDAPWIRTEMQPIYTSASADHHSREIISVSGNLASGEQESDRPDVQSGRVESLSSTTTCETSQTNLNVSGYPSHVPLRIPKYKYYDAHNSGLDARTDLTSESENHTKSDGYLHSQIPVSSIVSQALNEVSRSFTSQDLSVPVVCSSTIPISLSPLEEMSQNKTAMISGLKQELSQAQPWKKCRFVKQHGLADKMISSSRTSVQHVDITRMVNSDTSVAPVYTTSTVNCQTTGFIADETTKHFDKLDSEHASSHLQKIKINSGTSSSIPSDAYTRLEHSQNVNSSLQEMLLVSQSNEIYRQEQEYKMQGKPKHQDPSVKEQSSNTIADDTADSSSYFHHGSHCTEDCDSQDG